MNIENIKVIVFDFDGTLVQSNQIKYDAYFDLFPKDESTFILIKQILSEHFERSRYFIIEKIISKKYPLHTDLKSAVQKYAKKYNRITLNRVSKCPEVENAGKILKKLYKTQKIYLSSNTPEKELKELISQREWDRFFSDIFGFPKVKIETLSTIIKREMVLPSEVVVVGDGKSDQTAAGVNKCIFFQANPNMNLMELMDN